MRKLKNPNGSLDVDEDGDGLVTPIVPGRNKGLPPAPLVHGLTAVCGAARLLHDYRDLAGREFSTGKHGSKGSDFEPCEVIELYGGGGRIVDVAKEYAQKIAPKTKLLRRTFRGDGDSRHFEYASNEGLKTLAAVARNNPGSLLTFEARSLAPTQLQSRMQKLRTLGRDHGVNFMMLIEVSDDDDETAAVVQDSCDRCFKLRSCDPDPDALKAFVIEDAELDILSFTGDQSMMCQMHQREDGLLARRFTPYLAGTLEERLTWELYAHGLLQVQLASILKVDPSTISRGLKKLPHVRPGSRPMDEERLKMVANFLGFEVPVAEIKKVRATARLVDKVEKDDEPWPFEDDDSTDAKDVADPPDEFPVKQAKAVKPSVAPKTAGLDVEGWDKSDSRGGEAPERNGTQSKSAPQAPRHKLIKSTNVPAKKKGMSAADKKIRRDRMSPAAKKANLEQRRAHRE